MNDLTSEKMDELIAVTRKQKNISMVIAVALIILVLLLTVTAVLMIPRITQAMEHMEETMTKLDDMADTVSTSMEGSTDAFSKLQELDFENLNKTIGEAASKFDELDIAALNQAISDATGKLGDIDVDALNQAISDLNTAVQPLVELQNLFR